MSNPNPQVSHAAKSANTRLRFADAERRLHCKIDRLFVRLFAVQWVFAIVLAVFVSPLTWKGDTSQLHPHLLMAITVGGFLTVTAAVLVWLQPGDRITRLTIATSQVIFSALLIDITGGRIETHFHVFGSLAFLLLYRDWRAIVVATAVVVIDHLLRGILMPRSVFGVDGAPLWRVVEHAAWVAFEDVVLLYGCTLLRKQMWQIAERDTENHMLLDGLDRRVKERTAQLHDEIEQRKASEADARAARVRAESANQAKTAFLANMSHEIRTPMTAIIGFADLIAEDLRNLSPEARNACLQHIETIRRNGNHLMGVINDILEVARIDAGKLMLESVPLDCRRILAEVYESLHIRATRKGLSFTRNCGPNVPPNVLGDPTRIRQILLNIVGNAIKFTESGSVDIELTCTTSPGGDIANVRFEIHDTGIGIDPAQMKRLFNAFEQGDTSMNRRYGGSGLGLCISQQIARAMGGDVRVQSEVGEGSLFVVDLPLRLCPAASAGGTDANTPGSDPIEGMRVLVVEDGTDNQTLVRFLLARFGAQATFVENGKLAVERLTADGTVDGPLLDPMPFDMVLMDMQMPIMDGYTATGLLKRKGLDIPIVALTAHAVAGEREKCLAAGCDAYVSKPINPELLKSTIHAAFHPVAIVGQAA